jgi:hypothetical protein
MRVVIAVALVMIVLVRVASMFVRVLAVFFGDELRGETPARSTRVAETPAPSIARLPSARRSSSSGRPASSSAPSTMSPDAPLKQSKYRIRDMSIRCPLLSASALPNRKRHSLPASRKLK